MEQKFVILCCENIRPEIDAVLADGSMPLAAAESFPYHCGHVQSVWDTLREPFGVLDSAGAAVCLCGCGCANPFSIPREARDNPLLVLAEAGASLFLQEALASEFRRYGAYLILPGWLLRWKLNAEKDGLDRDTARQMFGESLSAIVLLDTGIRPDIAPVLEEFSAFTGLPARSLPVGLDYLRLRLSTLYREWEGREAAAGLEACRISVNTAERRVADYSMVADLTGMIIGVNDENDVIGRVLDHIVRICSPQRTAFLPVREGAYGPVISVPPGTYPDAPQGGGPPQFPVPEEQYRILETGDGFRLRVEYNRDLIGVLSIEEVSLPSALDEYINLTFFIARIAGLSIAIARTHANLVLAMKTREAEIAERIQTEIALRDSEEKYRTLIESSFDGIAIHRAGILVYVNRTAARLLGSDNPDEFTGRPVRDIVAPEFRKQIDTGTQGGAADVPGLVREQFVRLDGSLIDVDVTTAPSMWEGRPAAYVTFRDITAQVRAEKALRDSEEKYRAIINDMQDIFYRTDMDGKITMLSPSAVMLAGYDSPDQLIGQDVSVVYANPADRDYLLTALKETGSVYAYPLDLRVHDGSIRHVTTSSHFFHDPQGKILGVEGVIHDITRQRKAEDALRESEEKYRALVETTSDFIWEVDTAGRYTYVSPQVERLLGYTPGEIAEKTPFDTMPPDEAQRVSAEFFRRIKTRMPIVSLEKQCLRKDGRPVILETSGVPRYGKDGSFAGYRGIDRDITRRKEAERALRESEERYRNIIENIQDVYFRIGGDGRIEMVSPSAARTFGYPGVEDLTGKPILSLWKDPGSRLRFLDAMREQGGAVHDWEAEFVKTDGTPVWVSISAHLRFDGQGREQGTEGIIRDISGRKKTEESLVAALTKLNMLSSITRHDILNQVTGLRTFLELSKEDLKGTKHEKFIEKEDQAAEAIQRQIEFTKFYQDIGVNAPKWQDAGEVIREAAGQLSLPGIGLDIAVNGIEVFADPLIVKVFFNLMENSLRHGGQVTQMAFGARESEEGLVITYRDNGIGIALEDKVKLFRKGFGKHTGLGLFLSREILAITGITITENGTPGSGVRFEIAVPKLGYRLAA